MDGVGQAATEHLWRPAESISFEASCHFGAVPDDVAVSKAVNSLEIPVALSELSISSLNGSSAAEDRTGGQRGRINS
jgi:hypothetical protein